MRRLFVSDIHLETPESPQFQAFERLLTTTPADEVYLLGDITEMWIGDDDDAPLAQAFGALCTRISRDTRLFFLPGNRDFLLGRAFADRTGMTLCADPLVLDDHIVVTHGDQLCTDDAAYQTVRGTLRSTAWQSDILARPLAERRALGQAMRQQSKATNANKAENIMDVNADAVAALLRDSDAEVLIHGHTHRPGVQGDRTALRLVLGAWDHCAWWVLQHNDQFSLHTGPL